MPKAGRRIDEDELLLLSNERSADAHPAKPMEAKRDIYR
jgi:hypothetical protein